MMHQPCSAYRATVVEDDARVVTVEHEASSNSFAIQLKRLDALGVYSEYKPSEVIVCAEQATVMLWVALTYALFSKNDGCLIRYTDKMFDESGHATTEGQKIIRQMLSEFCVEFGGTK